MGRRKFDISDKVKMGYDKNANGPRSIKENRYSEAFTDASTEFFEGSDEFIFEVRKDLGGRMVRNFGEMDGVEIAICRVVRVEGILLISGKALKFRLRRGITK